MDSREIALHLTLKSIEENKILVKGNADGSMEDVNAFNAEQIANFYKKMYETAEEMRRSRS